MPSRAARSLICRALSSPLTYSTRRPSRQRLAQTWISRVLLPMPGSPPMSIRLPSTMPPPSTRSSSAIPVEARRVSSSGISVTGRAAAPVPGRWRIGLVPAALPAGSAAMASSSVFQAPQPGQRPAQRGVSYPQAVQAKTARSFANPDPSSFSHWLILPQLPPGVNLTRRWSRSPPCARRSRPPPPPCRRAGRSPGRSGPLASGSGARGRRWLPRSACGPRSARSHSRCR